MSAALSMPELSEPFVRANADRMPRLLSGLHELTRWHHEHCPAYARMLDGMYGEQALMVPGSLMDVPYLPVRMFKHLELASVPVNAIVRRLTSSGTTGQQVSRILLDAETSALQVRALAAIVQDFIGRQRLPMLILDQQDIMRGKAALSARAAGILGFANFGRQHTYALDEHMQPRWDVIDEFCAKHRGAPVLLFGFTWVIWQHFLQQAMATGRALDFGSQSILVHGGGWKKLTDLHIDNATFKRSIAQHLGIQRVSNYYGMVEQVGSIFMECEAGHLHAPAFADVRMRDLQTLRPSRHGAVEVFSLLPRSYPGHAILTEDVGTLLGEDDCACGRRGVYFHVHGRIPQTELRGCSDVRTTA